MIEIQEAYAYLEQTFKQAPDRAQTMEIAVEDSLGHYLAEPVLAQYNSPPFNQSAMDGVAFRFHPEQRTYKVVGTIAAGDPPDAINPEMGCCVRIMTGAPVPSGADTVEMVENVTFSGEEAFLEGQPRKGQHIRICGENTAVGDVCYEPGMRVTAGVLAGLYSQGVRFIKVRRPLRVGIAATGDELVGHYKPLQPGQIHNSNGPGLKALLGEAGIQILDLGVFPDETAATRDCLMANLDLDMIILSGGVSMGDFDQVPGAAKEAGFRQVFHKIRMKPGKPVWFGVHEKGTYLFGLPGNPVSVTVGALLFVQPMLRALQTSTFHQPAWITVPITQATENKSRLTLFKGLLLEEGEGQMKVRPIETSGSGDLAHFSVLAALGRLSPGVRLNSGDEIQILLPFLR